MGKTVIHSFKSKHTKLIITSDMEFPQDNDASGYFEVGYPVGTFDFLWRFDDGVVSLHSSYYHIPIDGFNPEFSQRIITVIENYLKEKGYQFNQK